MAKRTWQRRSSGVWLISLGLSLLLMLCSTAGWTGAPPAAAGAEPELPEIDLTRVTYQRLRAPVEWHFDREPSAFSEIQLAPFQPLQDRHVSRGVDDGTYWLRVRLVNPGETDRSWLIRHETSYLDHLTVYYRDQDSDWQQLHLSDREPFGARPLDTPRLAWSHATPAGSHTDLYLRLNQEQPDVLTLNVELWDGALYLRNLARNMLLSGFYYGMLLLVLLVTLSGALLLRQRLWLWYSLLVVFTALTWGAVQGLTFQYLWPQFPTMHNQGFHLLYIGLTLTALQFSKGFLRTAERLPRVHRVISLMQIGLLAGVGLRLLGFYLPVLIISFTGFGLLALLLPALGFHAWRNGLRYARWYAIAWSIYSVSLVASLVAATTNLLPWGMTPLVYSQAAGLLEALLLLAALAESLLAWDRERRAALRAAQHDALTGLGNRRRLSTAFKELMQRRTRDQGEAWFIALIDLDEFKQINDQFGHAAGDRILQHFARLLRQHTRPSDVCIRHGGEEFAILFQAPTLPAARSVIERIRTEFARHPTHFEGTLIPHTFSAGVTRILPDAAQPLSTVLQRADQALYAAKAAGRNRVKLADQVLEEVLSPA
ncbi:MAG: diguanylate cyclase [Spongiibacteraceae bacterium]|nr:diguanylate cyclase [Spongiibacteraceae bacterium]